MKPSRLTGLFLLCCTSLMAGASCSPAPTPLVFSEVSPASDALPSSEAGWEMVWEDHFTAPDLDRTKWEVELSCWGGGNEERQCYTDRPENIRIEGGALRLIARREHFTGPVYPQGMVGAPGGQRTQPYTSGKIRTRGLASWTYGRVSARMMLPEGLGTWSAFWMMPEGDVYGNWPLSGEIDIMEAINLAAPCAGCEGGTFQHTSAALHFGGLPPRNTYLYQETDPAAGPGPGKEWRIYSVEWAQGVIQWLVDGKVFLRLTSADWYTDAPAAEGRAHAPFDQPFYLMFNLAVGGNLAEKSAGGGFDPASFPAQLAVDWVRVEQCASDKVTGLACLTQQNWQGQPKGPWEQEAPG